MVIAQSLRSQQTSIRGPQRLKMYHLFVEDHMKISSRHMSHRPIALPKRFLQCLVAPARVCLAGFCVYAWMQTNKGPSSCISSVGSLFDDLLFSQMPVGALSEHTLEEFNYFKALETADKLCDTVRVPTDYLKIIAVAVTVYAILASLASMTTSGPKVGAEQEHRSTLLPK